MRSRRHLGAIVGSKEYKRQYVSETVQNWMAFAHEAYAAFVFGYQRKFTDIM